MQNLWICISVTSIYLPRACFEFVWLKYEKKFRHTWLLSKNAYTKNSTPYCLYDIIRIWYIIPYILLNLTVSLRARKLFNQIPVVLVLIFLMDLHMCDISVDIIYIFTRYVCTFFSYSICAWYIFYMRNKLYNIFPLCIQHMNISLTFHKCVLTIK